MDTKHSSFFKKLTNANFRGLSRSRVRGRRGHFGDLPKRNAGATHLAGAKTKMAEVGMNPLPSGYEYEFISTVRLKITTALSVTYLYENQFKQDVTTDSAKNVLMKRLEGMKIEIEFWLIL